MRESREGERGKRRERRKMKEPLTAVRWRGVAGLGVMYKTH